MSNEFFNQDRTVEEYIQEEIKEVLNQRMLRGDGIGEPQGIIGGAVFETHVDKQWAHYCKTLKREIRFEHRKRCVYCGVERPK
jgi:hypothetical protein